MSGHSTRYPFCILTYWQNNTAASADEAWDICEVSPFGAYTFGAQKFENTDAAKHRRDALIAFLEKAYELGKLHAKREIRAVLGVKGIE